MTEHPQIPLEEWRAQKKEECRQLAEQQNEALGQAVANGGRLMMFLYRHGQFGSRITMGNAALVLAAAPKAKAVKTLEEWNKLGRRIRKGARGIPVLTRRKGGLQIGYLFEDAQTTGKTPYQPLVLSGPAQIKRAIHAMVNVCPVGIVQKDGADLASPVVMNMESNQIEMSSQVSDAELFKRLPAVIVQAYLAQEGPEMSNGDLAKLYSAAVSVELCGRFGLSVLPEYKQALEQTCHLLEPGKEKEMLGEVRALAKAIGDHVEWDLQQAAPQRAAPKPSRPERG